MLIDDFPGDLDAILYPWLRSEVDDGFHRFRHTNEGSVDENEDQEHQGWKKPSP